MSRRPLLTFSQYTESIERKDDYADVSVDAISGSNTDTTISTYQPEKLRSTADKSKTLGYRVYYAYPYHSSDEITDLLKSLKGTGSLKIDRARLDIFLDKTAKYMAKTLKGNIDVVVCPHSSAPLARTFAYKLGKHLDVEVIYDAFYKQKITIPENKDDAIAYIINNFIDIKRFRESYKAKTPEDLNEALRKLAAGILRSVKKSGKVELKLLYKPTAKFAANFLNSEVHVKHRLFNQRVLVADDSFSSGGTMMEIFRQAADQMGAKELYGAVIFMQKSK